MADEREIRERFRIALELFDLGESMLRQRIRREQPDASEADIERKIREWLSRRPGAEHGDGPGRPIAWPRRGR